MIDPNMERNPQFLVDNVKFIHSIRYNQGEHSFLNASKAVMYWSCDGKVLVVEDTRNNVKVYVKEHNVITWSLTENPEWKNTVTEHDESKPVEEDTRRAGKKKESPKQA